MIPISKTIFRDEDFALIQEPLKSGWVVQGKYVKQFEDMFAEFVGAKYAIAVSNCTTALHIAVATLGIGVGDEVLVPSFTWISTANCVEYMGATPIFVDIDPHSYNIDVELIRAKITSRTKAIIPVHLFGNSANMNAIMAIAKEYGIAVIEDAACGFDTWYGEKHVGTIGAIGCFSFHPRKSITTGEGGMIITNDDHLAQLCRSYRDHGASRPYQERQQASKAFLLPEYNLVGYNFRLTDIQGALGVAQMQKAKELMQARRVGASYYDKILSDIAWLRLPTAEPSSQHSYQSYVCWFQPEEVDLDNVERLMRQRNSVMLYLEERGIITRQGTHAPPHQNVYARKYNLTPHDYPQGYFAERMTIALPLFPGITHEEMNTVKDNLLAGYTQSL